MKKKVYFAALVPLLLLGTSCTTKKSSEESQMETKPIDVVIISGQSNAVGCSHSQCLVDSMGIDKFKEYQTGYEEIKISYACWDKTAEPRYYVQNQSKDFQFVKTRLGQGNVTERFGPEIGIAEAMHEKYADKLFLIKCACGASCLRDDWATGNSIMYLQLLECVANRIKDLKDQGYEPTIKAFCWMQGEGDSGSELYADAYGDNLEMFVSNLREDLKQYAGNKELPFIDAGISNASPWVYYDRVNNAKKAFAAKSDNNIYIDTIAAGMHTNLEPPGGPDVYHYDSDSEILLGHLFAEQFEQFLTK